MAETGTSLSASELALIKAAVAVASNNVQQRALQQPVTQSSLQEFGRELLQQAADGKVDRIKELIKRGAPFTTDWLGTSPLHMAAMYGHYEVAEVLLEAGISRDARTKVDKSPLHLASTEGFTNIVELLLTNRAEVNCRDMLNMTPLHWAVERAHIECIEWLLRCGSDVTVKNKFDKTPRDIACDNGHPGIMEMLENYEVYRADNPLAPAAAENETTATEDAVNSILPELSQPPICFETKPSPSHLESEPPLLSEPVPEPTPTPAPQPTPAPAPQSQPQPQPQPPQSSPPDQPADGMSTLATIAEAAAAARRAGKKEALRLLASHGITMLPVEDPSTVPAALTSGKTISLTAAGALALGLTRPAADGAPPTSSAPAPATATASAAAQPAPTAGKPRGKVSKIIKLTPEQFAQLTGGRGKGAAVAGKAAPLQLKLPLSAASKPTGKPPELAAVSAAKRLKFVPVGAANGPTEAASRLTVGVASPQKSDRAGASPESTVASPTVSSSSATDVASLRSRLAAAEREAERLRQLCREQEAEAERCRRLLAAAEAAQ